MEVVVNISAKGKDSARSVEVVDQKVFKLQHEPEK